MLRHLCHTWLSVVTFVFSHAALAEQPSAGEYIQFFSEFSASELDKHVNADTPYKVPSDVNGPSQAMLIRIEQRRDRLTTDEAVHRLGSATVRTYIVGTGALVGTAIGGPLIGMAIGDSIHSMVESTMLKPELERIRAQYDGDVSRLIGGALYKYKQEAFKALKDAALTGDREKFALASSDVWKNQQSFISDHVLSALPDHERRALFEQGVNGMFETFRNATDARFELTDQQLEFVKGSVREVRAGLRTLEVRQSHLAEALRQHVEETRDSISAANTAISGLQEGMRDLRTDMRFLQENVGWQQLGTAQRIEALRMGWFPEMKPGEREVRIDRLTKVLEIEKISRPTAIASDVAGVMINAFEKMQIDYAIVKSLKQAQTNINTVQQGLGIATQIAMGNYLGAFGAASGLLGGGGADSAAAQHAEIMAALGQIDQKLDSIIKLQRQTFDQVVALRGQVRDMELVMSRRFDGLEQSQAVIVTKLMLAYWQHEGSEACRVALKELTDYPERGYNRRTGHFKTFSLRVKAFEGIVVKYFEACERFLLSVLAPDSGGQVKDFFQIKPDVEVIKAAQAKAGLPAEGLPFLSQLTIFNAMRELYLAQIPATTDSIAPNCDTTLFYLSAATPLHYEPYLAGEQKCDFAYRSSRSGLAPVGFRIATSKQLDAARIFEVGEILDMMAGFLILETGGKLRTEIAALESSKEARDRVLSLYKSFRDVLASAAADQAVSSGSVVAKAVADRLRKDDFGRGSCQAGETALFAAARCAALRTAQNHAAEVARLEAALAVAGKDEFPKIARDLSNVRIAMRRELSEADKEASERSRVAKVFTLLDELSTKRSCVTFTDDELKKAHHELAVESATVSGREFWGLAQIYCVLEHNPFLASNVMKVLTVETLNAGKKIREEDTLKPGTLNSYHYLAATAAMTPLIMEVIYKEMPVELKIVTGTPVWKFGLRDQFGWRLDFSIPLSSDVESPDSFATDARGSLHRVLSTETDAHKEIALLRARVDERIIALSTCTDADPCTQAELRFVKNLAIHHRKNLN